MSILTAPRSPVKSARPARVFGEGILPQTPTERFAERVAESSRQLRVSQAEHEAEAKAQGVGPRQINEAWKLGLDLGRDGIEAYAPEWMTFVERNAFRDGWDAGMSELCEGLARDAWEQSGIDLDAIEDGELAEARMSRPASYCFA